MTIKKQLHELLKELEKENNTPIEECKNEIERLKSENETLKKLIKTHFLRLPSCGGGGRGYLEGLVHTGARILNVSIDDMYRRR